jgi:hypothetical protein
LLPLTTFLLISIALYFEGIIVFLLLERRFIERASRIYFVVFGHIGGVLGTFIVSPIFTDEEGRLSGINPYIFFLILIACATLSGLLSVKFFERKKK